MQSKINKFRLMCCVFLPLLSLFVFGCGGKPIDIFDAVRKNDADFVGNWIKEGGDVNLFDPTGQSLLYIATGPQGGDEVLDVLLSQGANPNVGMGDYTPLMNAASWLNIKGVGSLIKHGANKGLKLKSGKMAIDLIADGDPALSEKIKEKLLSK